MFISTRYFLMQVSGAMAAESRPQGMVGLTKHHRVILPSVFRGSAPRLPYRRVDTIGKDEVRFGFFLLPFLGAVQGLVRILASLPTIWAIV